MKKIAFVNGKGGTGKTTLSVLTALAAADAGFEVGIHDTDPQQSIANWINLNKPEKIEIVKNDSKYRLVIVDTPPRLDDKNLVDSIKDVDSIFIVTSLSPIDVTTSKRTLMFLAEHNLAQKAKLLVNQYKKNTRLAKAQHQSLSSFNIPVLNNRIGSRQAYQLALLFGWRSLGSIEREELKNIIIEMISG